MIVTTWHDITPTDRTWRTPHLQKQEEAERRFQSQEIYDWQSAEGVFTFRVLCFMLSNENQISQRNLKRHLKKHFFLYTFLYSKEIINDARSVGHLQIKD